MSTPTIPAGNLYMNATLYTGNGGTLTVNNGVAGQSFQPDMLWVKSRSYSDNHALQDSVRGFNLALYPNLTNAEVSAGYASANSNGFNVAGNTVNTNGATYVGWNWKAGGTAVSNTAGSITSQVSANTTSGFSVVTYTGTGANATVGHGLGATPQFIITKSRSASGYWYSYHVSLGTSYTLVLNGTNAQISTANSYQSVSSTTYGIGTNGDMNTNGGTYVAYCWAPIAGYSQFGSYTGNGSTDGPFIYCGFRPRWIMVKSSSAAGNGWIMYDTARNTYNAVGNSLFADSSSAENGVSLVTENTYDVLSNGFKARTSNAVTNQSSATYIYAAFAENPFKYANAR